MLKPTVPLTVLIFITFLISRTPCALAQNYTF
jgi:hypothetical protein